MHSHFTICHWNLNSISAHNFFKIHLLKVNLPIHKFDIVCLSETYLESDFPFDDDNLGIPGYIMVRADHPANSKRGGACMYYKKNCLPLQVLDIRFIHESIAFDLRIGDKLLVTLDTLAQKKPFLLVAIGDFNAKSSNWYRYH